MYDWRRSVPGLSPLKTASPTSPVARGAAKNAYRGAPQQALARELEQHQDRAPASESGGPSPCPSELGKRDPDAVEHAARSRDRQRPAGRDTAGEPHEWRQRDRRQSPYNTSSDQMEIEEHGSADAGPP